MSAPKRGRRPRETEAERERWRRIIDEMTCSEAKAWRAQEAAALAEHQARAALDVARVVTPDTDATCGAAHETLRTSAPVPNDATSGVRLGRRERDLLLALAAARVPLVLVPYGMTEPYSTDRVEQETTLRAARKLARVGLIRTSETIVAREARFNVRVWPMDGRAYHIRERRRVRSGAISPLGAEIVERFRRELETGGRIRWERLEGGPR